MKTGENSVSVAKKRRPSCEYSVSLNLGGVVYESEGESVHSALKMLKPSVVKTRGVLTVRHKDKTSSISFTPFQVRKLIVNDVLKQIIDKRLNQTLR